MLGGGGSVRSNAAIPASRGAALWAFFQNNPMQATLGLEKSPLQQCVAGGWHPNEPSRFVHFRCPRQFWRPRIPGTGRAQFVDPHARRGHVSGNRKLSCPLWRKIEMKSPRSPSSEELVNRLMPKGLTPEQRELLPPEARQRYDESRKAMQEIFERNEPPLALKVGDDNRLWPDDPEEVYGWLRLNDALGGCEPDFMLGLISQIGDANRDGRRPNERDVNFVLSTIRALQPRDQLESMLAAQMAVVHMATMRLGGQLRNVKYVDEHDYVERALNKFARTYVSQMEALKRYRNAGQQNITVKHVSLQQHGGQAIVGNFEGAPRGRTRETASATTSEARRGTGRKDAPSAPPALTRAAMAPMPILAEPEEAMQGLVPAEMKK
jgi:hypothetical protein